MVETKPAKKKAVKAVKDSAKEGAVKVGLPRNYQLTNGVWRFSRSRMYHKRGLWKKIKKGQQPKPKAPQLERFATKPIGGDKNGGERRVRIKKLPSYYPTTSIKQKLRTRKVCFSKHKRYLRRSITPGTVLILIAGRHRGKRVVFLKQLKTGLLLVTGPYKINLCPLRRINQIYVIATKTKVDISGVKIPDHIDDDYFRRKRQKRSKRDEGEIFETKKEAYTVSDQRKEDQITVDRQIVDTIKKLPDKKQLFGYLATRFELRNGMYMHKLKF